MAFELSQPVSAGTGVPRFVAELAGLKESDRIEALSYEHPLYKRYVSSWRILLDAFEGGGGFLDGSYLWPYSREMQQDYEHRQKMARYHNYYEALIDLYVRYVFTQGVKRDSSSADYNNWTLDVDGAGVDLNEFLKRACAMALVCGHSGVLIDKTTDPASGPTQADENARVVSSIFTAPNILDWRFDQNNLIAIKLLEHTPHPSITVALPPPDEAKQYLIWDREGWARFDYKGNLLNSGITGLNSVPFLILRPKPSHQSQMIGRPLINNAKIIQALFNRASEEDQVLRDQAFSVLTVSISDQGDVEEAKRSLGGVIGTAKALIVKGDIKYETPDMAVPQAIRDNIAYLVQELYRAAHVRWRRDSLVAESGDAIRLQYAELNEMLQALCMTLAGLEKAQALFWFLWNSPTYQAGVAAFDSAQTKSEYPDEFFLDSLINDIQAWQEAIRMNLGETMSKRIKKRAARRVEPDIPPEELAKVDQEIEKQTPEDLNPELFPIEPEGGVPV